MAWLYFSCSNAVLAFNLMASTAEGRDLVQYLVLQQNNTIHYHITLHTHSMNAVYTTTITTVLRAFVQDYPGESVPEG